MQPCADDTATVATDSRWGNRLTVAFWAAVVGWVAVWAIAPNCRQTVTVAFTEATSIEHVGGHCYAAHFQRGLPNEAYVMEDSRELRFGSGAVGSEGSRASDLAPAQIAALGMGFCQVQRPANLVYWSTSDNTDPRTNGRAYTLIGTRRWRPRMRTLVVAAVLPLLLLLALTVWRSRRELTMAPGWRQHLADAADLRGASPRWLRWALALALLGGLLPLVTSTWNRYAIDTDTWDYCHGTLNRTPLTYFFLKALDARCDEPVEATDVRAGGGLFHDDFHYRAPVRAWKVLWLLAAAGLVRVLARFVNVWLLAGSCCWLAAALPAGNFFAHPFWLDYVISEPLCYCVELLFLAAAAQYLLSGRLCWGVLLGGLLAAAVLVRPSNNVFLAVLPAAWLAQRARVGFWRATVRAALLAVPLVLGTLAVCEYNQQQHGCFKTYSFKGYYLIAVAMQTATPDDVDAFTDPQLKEFMRLCVAGCRNMRNPRWSVEAADINTFGIAVPAFGRVYMDPLPWDNRPDLHNYYRQSEETFTTVSKTLLLRHPRAYFGVVKANLTVYWRQNPWTHTAALAALALALLLYWRSRHRSWLYLAFFAAAPLLSMLPCVLTLYPLERYGSQLFFAEIGALPLVGALALTRGLAAWRPLRLLTPPVVPEAIVTSRAA